MTDPAPIIPPPPSITIQRFGDATCPNCKAMKRAMTLEKWSAQHPNIKIEDYDLDNPAADEKADEYGIMAIPAFVLLDGDGNVVYQTEGAMNAMGLEKMYAKALKALEEGNLGSVPRRKKRSRR